MTVLNIQNDTLSVNIKLTGAELIGLEDLRDGVEHMWNADPKFWPRTAPILFPTIGESRDGKVWFDGIDYPMGRHGFVRHLDFAVMRHDADFIELQLVSNAVTKKHYPFDFKFRTSYRVEGSDLFHRFEVENTGDKLLPFQLGAHPAFAVPFGERGSFDDYEVRFSEKMSIDRHLLNAAGLYNGQTRRFLENEDRFRLSYEMFNEDAIVLKDIPSRSVYIQHKSGGKRLEVQYEQFHHLGIWSVPCANYVCIEPWIGAADRFDQSKDFLLKDSIIRVDPGNTFSATYEISLVH